MSNKLVNVSLLKTSSAFGKSLEIFSTAELLLLETIIPNFFNSSGIL